MKVPTADELAMMRREAAVMLGKMRSEAKAAAARVNGKLGGRPSGGVLLMLHNDRHGTATRVRVASEKNTRINRRQYNVLAGKLCGKRHCDCGVVTNYTVTWIDRDTATLKPHTA